MGTRGLINAAVCLGLAVSTVGCSSLDELPPPADKDRDSGVQGDGGKRDSGGPDRDAGDGGPCAPATEVCNGIDDDCDGVADDDDPEAQAYCESVIVNSTTFCGRVSSAWVCVPVECNEGFANCDGEPSNGCEPYCSCNECPDSGSEDGGAEDAGPL
jgi:hypothetical protein